MDIRQKIGERIREARLNADIRSAPELADKVGIKHKTLYMYESGIRLPKPETILSVAKITKSDPAWLMGLSDVRPENREEHQLFEPEGFSEIAFKPPLLNSLGLAKDKTFALRVKGDSMMPTLRDGDLVVVDKQQTAISDGIFAVKASDDVVVRRLQKKLDGSVVVISDNKEYPQEVLSSDAIKKLNPLGRVVWFGRSM